MQRFKNAKKIVVRKYDQRRPLRALHTDGKTKLELILGKWGRMAWTGCIWLRKGTSGRLL
jgi:hypothetical protein